MKVGIVLPQGWTGEYAGWEPSRAWARTVAVGHQAERLGFESIWLFDHFQTTPRPRDELTFEAFTSLSALAALTSRVRLGHLVLCAGYRNPALVAKMIGTLDVVSGGRLELGLGAGWKRDEWVAFGYGFPSLKDRLAMLADSLEVVTRMLAGGHATFEGGHASVDDAINLPSGLQSPRIPIVVGGNGPEVTWRLAARYADELNLDGVSSADTKDALPVIAARCEEIGRDPASLKVSVHVDRGIVDARGRRRQDVLGAFRDLGVSRIMALLPGSAASDEALDGLAEDVTAIGVALDPSEPA